VVAKVWLPDPAAAAQPAGPPAVLPVRAAPPEVSHPLAFQFPVLARGSRVQIAPQELAPDRRSHAPVQGVAFPRAWAAGVQIISGLGGAPRAWVLEAELSGGPAKPARSKPPARAPEALAPVREGVEYGRGVPAPATETM